jgi:hypothetical protein
MDAPELQWSGAEVSDGALVVPIKGERPKGWKPRFEQTVKLLGGGQWDEVTCKSGKVRVTGVTEGAEENLHHFLESAVQEANAAFESAGDDEADDQDTADTEDEGDDQDARLTARFRAFGG